MKSTKLSKKHIIRLLDAIWSDPDFKKRYDEINRKRNEECDKLYEEFRRKYTKRMVDEK